MILGYTKYQSRFEGEKHSYRDDSLDFPYFNKSLDIFILLLGSSCFIQYPLFQVYHAEQFYLFPC